MKPRNLPILLTAGLVLSLSACGGTSSDAKAGDVAITVACQPAKTAAKQRKAWDDDIAAFEKTHPGVKVNSTDQQPCFDPKTFAAKLAGGQMETVFMVPVTNYADVIAKKQAKDITGETGLVKNFGDIKQDVRDMVTKDGKVYGVPNVSYSVGLVYNRKLFTQAGLDPDSPPRTWDEVRAAAKKIAGLGPGYVGYGEYGGGNVGGWHFAQALFSRGGEMTADGKAAFNSPEGKAVLQTLHDMRWQDNSVGSKVLIGWEALMQQMAAGRTGMMLGAPDVVTDLVQKFQGSVDAYGIAGVPGGKASLTGGEAYMINPKADAAQTRAALQWIDFQFNTPGKGRHDYARGKANGEAVGVPNNDYMGDSPTGRALAKAREENAVLPTKNYRFYVEAASGVEAKLEPPKAQELYAVLDVPMSAVLTRKNADIDKLLADAEAKANSILAKG
ncbi:ABC transporter substrate-binding protein [Streptomyces candidus]|uniref:Multiple sugar transport system substrate-binding protein n=1 Tax=Streptomyces candidus TaxID=67283 RepID=A0A7X0HEA4_9ACTN|nr:extracellular solute-binding protein [Streptomyces candidus]MBB6435941.1 multiple sugar transport system substrate-binding protein [Streptomyces candidus]GHH43060.1 sugar ABC transporter substrate-binding protein [Streptomyces candidus]